jgi:hypothetical protein
MFALQLRITALDWRPAFLGLEHHVADDVGAVAQQQVKFFPK